MGEAPAFITDDLPVPVDLDWKIGLKLKDCQTAVNIGNKTYVIGGADRESPLIIGVSICDKSTGEWVKPTVLGTRPKPSKGHSAVVLNEDRILIIKADSADGDCFWFLEVDTPFIREQRKKHGREVVAWSNGVASSYQTPIVISGPSGVGKGTLISKLMKDFPSKFGFSVSHTTRAPREKEQNGVHYHFIERSIMEEEIRSGKFLEFASVHGNLYGTSIDAVEVVADAGKRCILDIDVQGARSVRASTLEAIFIFVCPPSFEELEKRLRSRGTETEEQIQKRLRNAKVELEQGSSSGIFNHILVNDDLENCYARLKAILNLNENESDEHEHSNNAAAPVIVNNMPVDISVSKIGQKMILINCGTNEQVSKNRLVLDVSSIKGGAPGRTRGLNIHSWTDCMNGVHQLS